ncbi:replication restart helicase PriA [Cardinium endosymbiont of Bemisia tabaci]|uniref:replication restart helicase PriA n=1 Tax=Cardinium endosymbiont of Bemisia tabaci TaxID=672794 RepID=UPI000442D21F|nr:primosomal protein N' [Cardinium endosymbiont of Bemisia tabaci]CDG49765.1 Primosomal protein N' [Cardinium endosymbiont cBtQ1 of Bemisia tabaci]
MKKFVDIILPLPIKALTYAIPSNYQDSLEIGSSVLVPLRSSKLLLGIVIRCHTIPPSYPTKDVLAILYTTPLFTAQQLAFLAWMADYYLSNLGETVSMAWPKVLHNIGFQQKEAMGGHTLSVTEQTILTALQHQSLSYRSIVSLIGQKDTNKALITLLSKRLVAAIVETGIDPVERDNHYVTLSPTIHLDPFTITKLAPRSPKQQALLAHFLPNKEDVPLYISKEVLLGYSKSAFHALYKKGILIKTDPPQLAPSTFTAPCRPLSTLTAHQKNALIEIEKQFAQKKTVLLYGAIGSGKTELYMHLIASALYQQKQVLFLVPEIGLITHIVERIRPFWGEWLVVHHSKQSNKERLKTWARLLNPAALLVIGTRSALLLPFKALQLIIIDEEHDQAYKQTDTMPTYHARESSILLAQQHQAKVLLGSATPSIESYYNGQTGKYGLVRLSHRFGTAGQPKLFFIDLNIEKKRNAMRENFSLTLLSKLEKNHMEGGQAMIFQNRRGYAPYFLCAACGWIPRCLTCSVSLTYHQASNHLHCHYCDYTRPPFSTCDHCGSKQLQNIGFGTEKLEESLQLIFPKQKIGRMDLDSTKGKNSYQSLLKEINDGSIAILVGTQMMAKGLDFANMRLIGIPDIDGLLYFPDFRSNEKCFQLITQLAGRAGRRHKQGSVFIQTRQRHHPLFEYLSNGDYEGMYHSELRERKRFLYPPYVRLIKLRLSGIDASTLQLGAIKLKAILEKKLEGMVLGPQQPLVGKIRNYFLLDLLLKIPSKNLSTLHRIKEDVRNGCKYMLSKTPYSKIKIVLDIDPI